MKVTATIYLGRGIHFLFSCTDSQSYLSRFSNFEKYPCIYNYCSELDLNHKYLSNDNFEITIMPLECDLENNFNFQLNSKRQLSEQFVLTMRSMVNQQYTLTTQILSLM